MKKKAYMSPTVVSEPLTIGVFGNYGRCNTPGSYSARVRWWRWIFRRGPG